MKIIKFNNKKINFYEFLKNIYKCDNLESIHLIYHKDNHRDLFNRDNDNTTELHQLYYDNIDIIKDLYLKLINEIFLNLYPNESFIIYQKSPALRISLPGNKSVGEMHTDFEYNHPEEEINFWLPITTLNEINTVWHESKPNLGDFKPILIKSNEIAIVNFNKCRHYAKINSTNKTRISLDFRIIPGSQWKESDKLSAFQNVKFTIGEYYEKLIKNF